jgi:hypothetical protein
MTADLTMTSGNESPATLKRRPAWVGRMHSFARRRWTVAILLAAAAFSFDMTVALARRPAPKFHDEFSYLLAGDTFASGRLANPTHPQWRHFETFHVIHTPSYASKYPPGQGLFLALGQWAVGEPLAGVWLLSAIGAVAVYWMLLGWTSPGWAAVGGLLFLLQPGYQLVWAQSYWGGTLALAGGALVFGAAVRMRRRSQVVDAAAMSVGATALAVSRPFEGFVFCVLTGAWVLWSWARLGPPPWRRLLVRTALPQVVVLGVAAALLGVYHRAVTGDPATFPYVVHERQYAQAPMFLGQEPSTNRVYNNEMIERFHSRWAMDWHRKQQTLAGVLRTKLEMTGHAVSLCLPPLLAIPLLFLRPWRTGRLTPVVVVFLAAFFASMASLWNFPHYMAPFAPLLFVGVVWGLRHGAAAARHLLPRYGFPAVIVGLQAVACLNAAVAYVRLPRAGWQWQRAAIAEMLENTPGPHLVLVRYGQRHDPCQEWVYNAADIDGSPVVWARALDSASDAELLRYFADRQAWLLEPDVQRLVPLSNATLAGAAR